MDHLVLLVIVLSNADVRPITKGLSVVAAMTSFMAFLPVNLANVMYMDRPALTAVLMGDAVVMLVTQE